MNHLLMAIALFLLVTLGAGLLRVVRGPTNADRMIAGQLFGTVGVAFLLVLADVANAPALRDVALVLALLASVIVVAFVKRGWVRQRTRGEADE